MQAPVLEERAWNNNQGSAADAFTINDYLRKHYEKLGRNKT